MDATRKWLCAAGLWLCAGGGTLSAQTFRRITQARDLEAGARYVLGSYCRTAPDSVFVMAGQAATGTGFKTRRARKVKPDGDRRIRVDHGQAAVFELVKEGVSTYAFRDVELDAWLAYSDEKVTAHAGLYTLTGEELEEERAAGRDKWYKTFVFDPYQPGEGRTTSVLSKERIENSRGKSRVGLSVDYVSQVFRLYVNVKDKSDTLFIYKEILPPTVEGLHSGDWTFRGDWTADTLSRLDFSQAGRIDFTEIPLPPEGQWDHGVRLPEAHVWTYVREGEAGHLPAAWPNVVEIEDKEERVQGRAATRMVGNDRGTWGPKYVFEVPQGTGIDWYRTVDGGDGWYTSGLPFEVERVTWDDAGGEALPLERMAFVGVDGDGVVFRPLAADALWEAGRPYLWRPEAVRGGTVCFHADGVTVGVVPVPEDQGAVGFYANYSRLDIGEEAEDVRFLDDAGRCFVRPDSGSWLNPGRAYLRCEAGAAARLMWRGETSGVETARTPEAGRWVPVYTTDGKKVGEMRLGEPLPDRWPEGIYVTPGGKFRVGRAGR